jgi:hypothetical protein
MRNPSPNLLPPYAKAQVSTIYGFLVFTSILPWKDPLLFQGSLCLHWSWDFWIDTMIIRLFGFFNIDYNLVQCLGLLFLSCMNQLVFLPAIFVCMRKSLSHLLDCTTLFHLKFGHELHEKSQFKNQLIDYAWSRQDLTIWFN